MRFKDKVVIVTGAARGIGRETTRRFAQEGAKLVICDLDEEGGRAAAAECEKLGGTARFHGADVSRRADVQAMVEATIKEFGRIDVLVNNAGILRDATLLKMTEEQWDTLIAVNLKGVFNCTQAVAPQMVAQGSGRIINLTSVVALYGNFGQTNYIAAKAGVIGMTRVWARELGRKGINVNAVAPGFIATEMVRQMPENILDTMKQRTPLGRLGEPAEIAAAIAFLASDDASFINGAVLSVDGGIVTGT